MEQVRLLAAIGLSFLVLFIWSAFFTDDLKIESTAIKNNSVEETTTSTSLNKIDSIFRSTNEAQIEEPFPLSSGSVYVPREITVDTPLFRMVFSEQGGLVKSAVLKKYKEGSEEGSSLKELVSEELSYGGLFAYFVDNNASQIEKAIFTPNIENNYLEVLDEEAMIEFTYFDSMGRVLVKSFKFKPNSYLVDVDIKVKNTSNYILNDSLVLSLKDKTPNKSSYGFEGPSAYINGHLKQFKPKEIDKSEPYSGKINWIAIENRYFMSGIVPASDFIGHVELNRQGNEIENKIVSSPFQLYPEQELNFRSSLFMGPKSITVLGDVGHNMEKAIYFGLFDFIAKPCLWFMNKIYSIIPNYGVAIILLTVFTKLLLWPLGSKGYKSMSEMKKLQPLMANIREKHKADKQKMNKEIMALYKTYKVNPMGGCLPMLLQIPVFFALYRMLYQAIELRHTPFVFWINDLSAPDRLFNFGFSIPFMQPPYGIPVLTIIMGATMLLQQKMSPPPGDSTQAKMMMMMPIIFTFIFINFSSGLVLYWLVNNILSISQQYYIQKKTT